MELLIALVCAMAVCLIVVPVMVRLAPAVGMIDIPDRRKVHASPVPRVGGIGIVAGAAGALLLLLPGDPLVQAYLAGTAVLLVFGAWDDSRELGPYIKFTAQVIAVLPVVLWAGLQVKSFPLLSMPLPVAAAVPFTVFALVGMINAVNTSDGLDGLAGGESLLTLAGTALLAHLAGGGKEIVVAAAATGAVLGFLRYNTHPARIFMGDSGSQFLGFTSGALVVLLTQQTDPELSPAIVLPLLGLPVIDLLYVVVKRMMRGTHPMRPHKDHIHHRLLALGLSQKQTVMLIYSMQFVLVSSGVLFRHESDVFILSVYVVQCMLLFGVLRWSEQRGLGGATATQAERLRKGSPVGAVVWVPRLFLEVALPAYLVIMALSVDTVPEDLSVFAAALTLVALIDAMLFRLHRSLIRKSVVFLCVAVAVYGHVYLLTDQPLWNRSWEAPFFMAVGAAVAAAVWFSPRRRQLEFRTTATDYLVAAIAAGVLLVMDGVSDWQSAPRFLAYLLVVFYASELLMTERRRRFSGLGASLVISMGLIAYRGFV